MQARQLSADDHGARRAPTVIRPVGGASLARALFESLDRAIASAGPLSIRNSGRGVLGCRKAGSNSSGTTHRVMGAGLAIAIVQDGDLRLGNKTAEFYSSDRNDSSREQNWRIEFFKTTESISGTKTTRPSFSKCRDRRREQNSPVVVFKATLPMAGTNPADRTLYGGQAGGGCIPAYAVRP